MLTPELLRGELQTVRQQTDRPINVNFFCHVPPVVDAGREAAWRKRLARYYEELGVPASAADGGAVRTPYGAAMGELLLEFRPKVASFHFGLPEEALLKPLRDAGILIVSSATTVDEARWLEGRGVDAVIAQGAEAGGHRGMFLTDDIASQPGTMALVPQVVDAVKVPVIAAGGIADGRGVAAALALGAAGVQIGTAFLLSPEAKVSQVHRTALKSKSADVTALTNVFTGRPARGVVNRIMREVGPLSAEAPSFPLAAGAAAPLRAAAEATGSGDFSPLWSGQAALLVRELPTSAVVAALVEETAVALRRVQG
jgi:nitronate monooxygenase